MAESNRFQHINREQLVIEETTYRGRVRLRCTVCQKVAYTTEGRAERAAATIRGNPKGNVVRSSKMRHYEGDCGWWHLTSTSVKKARR